MMTPDDPETEKQSELRERIKLVGTYFLALVGLLAAVVFIVKQVEERQFEERNRLSFQHAFPSCAFSVWVFPMQFPTPTRSG
jgi:hypothetical protein